MDTLDAINILERAIKQCYRGKKRDILYILNFDLWPYFRSSNIPFNMIIKVFDKITNLHRYRVIWHRECGNDSRTGYVFTIRYYPVKNFDKEYIFDKNNDKNNMEDTIVTINIHTLFCIYTPKKNYQIK